MLDVRSIVVPLDFSVHSERALSYAIELGKQFRAKLHLVHCYGVDRFNIVPYDPYYAPSFPEGFDEQLRKAARSKLALCRDRVIAEGLDVDNHLSRLAPADAVLGLADDVKAGLIVMGTRGLTGLRHIVLGSVAEIVIRAARCPVLAVKADEDQAGENYPAAS